MQDQTTQSNFGDTKASLAFSNMLREQLLRQNHAPAPEKQPIEGDNSPENALQSMETGQMENTPISTQEQPQIDIKAEIEDALKPFRDEIKAEIKEEMKGIKQSIKDILNE